MKHENVNGVYYSLPERFAFDQENKYHGCGNGQIVVSKETGEVLDMAYLDENDDVIREQNIAMHPDAGEVISEDEATITYRANFSCWQACLF